MALSSFFFSKDDLCWNSVQNLRLRTLGHYWSLYIGKIYGGSIQVVDRRSTRSISIHPWVLPIHFRVLSMALRVFISFLELFFGSSNASIFLKSSWSLDLILSYPCSTTFLLWSLSEPTIGSSSTLVFSRSINRIVEYTDLF